MAVSSDLADDLSEMVGGCCVCSDERGWDENPLVYCDGQGCNVAVHQACYGIVTVPSGPWFCRKCESQERAARVRCELCPSRDGALKRTDSNGWAHVVCALYIPEVRFGNVTTMEPILISLIPPERFNKTCCICDESSAKGSKSGVGACMQCNKPGCKQNFHVTCAQMLGLLCEEAGNMLDNVKYCGYCQYHYSKLKKTSNMKIIPPFRPVPNSPHQSSQGPESSSTQGNGSKEQISPDISKISGLKKKLSGSSSTSNSSKGSVSSSHHSSSAMPRIAPSNLFASSNSYSSLGKSSDRAEISPGDNVVQKPAEDSYVLKSDDLKSSSSSSEPKKFLKANNDFMTVKLNDVLTASLDRPIHETPPRDKAQPPDIKPHVTLTPIPMRSSDKPQDKSSGLFGQQTASIGKSKETTPLPPTLEAEGSLAEISPTLFSHETKHSPSKRSSRMSMELDSPTSSHAAPDLKPVTGLDRATPPNWDSSKSQSSNQRGSSTDRVIVLASGSTGGSVEETSKITSVDDQSSQPLKRGPGRPVKRRNSGPSKEEERAEDPKKKSKRGGRRGGSSYSRNDSGDGPSFADENSNDGPKKQNGTTRKSNPMPKRQEETTPTLSQLRAQKEASAKPESSASILPAHMFGNALNPASSMAQRMVDTLSQEMETIVAAGVVLGEKEDKPSEKLVGIQLPKYAATSVLNGTPTNGTPSSSGSSSNPPQTLEQLLERQWEQGSQFLMEQAQHLDIAQLLSCLNQLKQDNRALEDHVSNLMQRKEQLIAINARLSIPLANSLAVGGGSGAAAGERGHDGPGTQQRPSPADIPVIHTQPQTNGRPVNYSGHQVPVVISSHPSPHLNQGHSGRQ